MFCCVFSLRTTGSIQRIKCFNLWGKGERAGKEKGEGKGQERERGKGRGRGGEWRGGEFFSS